MKYVTLIISIILALGCAHMPIGYYTFLRLTVFAAGIVIIIADRKRGVNFSNVIWALIAILFNPIFPVYLHNKLVWIIIDAAVACLFAYKTYYYYKTDKTL